MSGSRPRLSRAVRRLACPRHATSMPCTVARGRSGAEPGWDGAAPFRDPDRPLRPFGVGAERGGDLRARELARCNPDRVRSRRGLRPLRGRLARRRSAADRRLPGRSGRLAQPGAAPSPPGLGARLPRRPRRVSRVIGIPSPVPGAGRVDRFGVLGAACSTFLSTAAVAATRNFSFFQLARAPKTGSRPFAHEVEL